MSNNKCVQFDRQKIEEKIECDIQKLLLLGDYFTFFSVFPN